MNIEDLTIEDLAQKRAELEYDYAVLKKEYDITKYTLQLEACNNKELKNESARKAAVEIQLDADYSELYNQLLESRKNFLYVDTFVILITNAK